MQGYLICHANCTMINHFLRLQGQVEVALTSRWLHLTGILLRYSELGISKVANLEIVAWKFNDISLCGLETPIQLVLRGELLTEFVVNWQNNWRKYFKNLCVSDSLTYQLKKKLERASHKLWFKFGFCIIGMTNIFFISDNSFYSINYKYLALIFNTINYL